MNHGCRGAERPQILSVSLVKVDKDGGATVKLANLSKCPWQRAVSKFGNKRGSGGGRGHDQRSRQQCQDLLEPSWSGFLSHAVKTAAQSAPHDLCARPEKRIVCAQEEDLITIPLWQPPHRSTVCLKPKRGMMWQERAGEKPVFLESLGLHCFIQVDRRNGIGIEESRS